MKVSAILWKFFTYVFASALFVFTYAFLTHLLGSSRSPTTIEQFLVLFVLQFGTSIMTEFYMNQKKKLPATPEAK